MRSFFTGDTHAEEMLKPGDPLYDRIQRIRDHLRAERGEAAAEDKHGDWRDLLVSYTSADPLSWPRGGPQYTYAFYPMDQSGSMPAGDDMGAVWSRASAAEKTAARAAAETIIEGVYTFVGETDA